MKVTEIRAVLHSTDALLGVNLYPGEPTPLHHCVSVKLGMASKAIKAINAAGGKAWHGHAFGPYSESISVQRKE
jgi:hypothetical protein